MSLRLSQLAKLSLFIIVTVGFSSAQGQRWADADGNPVINPLTGNDFSVGGPVFSYYRTTGILTVNNVGPNDVVDSPDNLRLLGDDFGLISFLITVDEGPGSEAQSLLPDGFTDGILWNTFFYLNGKIQFAGSSTPLGQFLPIDPQETPLLQLPAGLTLDDFRNENGNITLETGMNYELFTAGATLFSVGDPIASGAFNIIVPEPSSLTLLGISCFFGIGYVQRRRQS